MKPGNCLHHVLSDAAVVQEAMLPGQAWGAPDRKTGTPTTNKTHGSWLFTLLGPESGRLDQSSHGAFRNGARVALPFGSITGPRSSLNTRRRTFRFPRHSHGSVNARSGAPTSLTGDESYVLPFQNGTEPSVALGGETLDADPGSSNAGAESLLKQIF
jgi:penicillin-binding protein 1A